MSSPSTNQNTTSTLTTTVRDQTCLKMASLTNPSSSTSSSSPLSAASLVNSHCSMGQQAGNTGLAPIMEIREMNTYCNSCVGAADKYWNHHHHHPHHHHHGTPPLVPSNVVRHPVVYPQMYFTPPPPPPPSANYSSASGTGASHDWTCPPSANADSYSHFIYSQYPPPSQHDYSNYLSISSGWPTAESDMMMMGAAGPTQLSSTGSSCEPPVVVPPTQSMINSFMYPASLPPPPPPQPLQVSTYESHINSAISPPSSVNQRKAEKSLKPESYNRPLLSSASPTLGDSSSDDSDEDTEDEEKSRHIISIEDDDDNDSIVEEEDDDISLSAVDTSSCLLCKKCTFMNVLSQSAPSPQLSRILENIDDDELDISVCSGDIEIGGIEDEMIQQATEQQNGISVQRLSQLVGLSVAELLSQENRDQRQHSSSLNEEQDAPLCFKCQKLVGMAESLEKQLNSVLCTIRQQVQIQTVSGDDGQDISGKFPLSQFNSVAIQTDFNEDSQAFIVVSKTKDVTYSIRLSDPSTHLTNNHNPPSRPLEAYPSNNIPMALGPFLCHECGRTFSIRRNLGKHLKRQHYESWHGSSEKSSRLLTCDRENCGKICYDKTALQIHSRKHTSEKPYFCKQCLKLFTTKSNLTAHKKSNVCGVKSLLKKTSSGDDEDDTSENLSPSNLTISQSTDPPIFRCENCSLTFRTEGRFHRHIKAPCNKHKIFQCDICSKPFAKRSELQAHLVVHTGAKSFSCDICGLTFSTKGNQRVHQRTHLTDKRFKCQQCDKGFTRNQTLQAHIANAHKKL